MEASSPRPEPVLVDMAPVLEERPRVRDSRGVRIPREEMAD